MTKRHFEGLARMVHAMTYLTPADRLRVAQSLALLCEAWNPRFDRERFLRACGVSEC